MVKIGIIGDIVLDTYHYGNVSRVSPEFPVQILSSLKYNPEYAPGGASNVAHQLSNFDCEVSLFGFTDDHFMSCLPNLKFNNYCVKLTDGHIPRKIRFYDNDFPLLRWDIESPKYGESNLVAKREEVFKTLMNHLDKLDVLIISDYDKGLFGNSLSAKRIIEECNKKGVLTLVDPKKHVSPYKGCTIFKPNSKEARELSGENSWERQCDYFGDQLQCETVIITQAGSGVVGKNIGETDSRYFEHHPHKTIKEVSSTIGAGDCFIAILAYYIAGGNSHKYAAEIAFEAGTEYVKAKHNHPIHPYDIKKRLDPIGAKVIDVDELSKLKNHYNDRKFIFTNGVFDIIHSGHLDLLNYAKSLGDHLIVAVNSDESVRRLKGSTRPVNSMKERMRTLANLNCVDFVIYFEEDTPIEVIKQLGVISIVKGGDYDKTKVVGAELVGYENVHIFEFKEGYSTTNIINKINELRTL